MTKAKIATVVKLPWRQRLYRLAVKRAALEKASNELQVLQWDFQAQHKDLLKRIDDLKEATKELEELVRNEALEEFVETGDKDPAPGIKFRKNVAMSYDDKKAIAWAQNNAPDLLKLDTKEFEKRAKALHEAKQALPFVEIDDGHMTTISKSLPLQPNLYREDSLSEGQ
jgi:hypothetical protein